MIASPRPPSPPARMTALISRLHLDETAHPERANHHKHHGDDEHDQPRPAVGARAARPPRRPGHRGADLARRGRRALSGAGDRRLRVRRQDAGVDEILASIRHAAVAASSFTASGLAKAVARRRTTQQRLALSPREAEVLRLLGDGQSVPTIARAMFISQSTAKTYVARLYEKLGAANRAQALM